MTYGYDALGNQTSETHVVSGATVRAITTAYDSLGRETEQSEARSGATVLTRTWSYPDPGSAGETEVATSYGGLTQTQASDERELETEDAASIDGATLTRTVTSRDDADNITGASLTGALAAAWSYGYDEAGRLTTQLGSGLETDAYGNAAVYTYGSDCSLKASDSIALSLPGKLVGSYGYDERDRLTSDSAQVDGATVAVTSSTARGVSSGTRTISVTGSGATTLISAISDYNSDCLTSAVVGGVTWTLGSNASNGWRTSAAASGTTYSYAYNGSGRLTSASASNAGYSASYAYDAAGQRLSKAVTVSSQTTTSSYLYDGLTLLSLSASQSGGSEPTSWQISYLYDENGTPYAAAYRSPANAEAATVFSIVTSDRGDVLELLDANGNAFASYAYDSWGNPITSGTTSASTSLISSSLAASIASRQVLRYAGYAYDEETGFYYCSARYYDPKTHEFTSKDPINADEEESAYLYCGGEPVGQIDASGEKCLSVPKVKQPCNSSWCWCACGVSVIHWYFPKSKVTQAKFCDFVKGKVDHDLSADENGVCNGLWHWDVGYNIKWVTDKKGRVIWNLVKTVVNAECAPIVGTDNPAHFWVLCGYKVKGGEKRVRLMNPTDGGYHWMSLGKLRKQHDLESMILTSKQVH